MGAAKGQWIERTGGFSIGESDSDFQNRVTEIEKLERLLVSGNLDMAGLDRTQRRLCELKGIDFDSEDD